MINELEQIEIEYENQIAINEKIIVRAQKELNILNVEIDWQYSYPAADNWTGANEHAKDMEEAAALLIAYITYLKMKPLKDRLNKAAEYARKLLNK